MKGLFALSLAAIAAAVPTTQDATAPLLANEHADTIPNSYIIKFKKHVSDTGASDHHAWVTDIHSSHEQVQLELKKRSMDSMFAGIKHTYKLGEHFLGYSGHFDENIVNQIRSHPDVSCSQARFLLVLDISHCLCTKC